MTPVFFDLDPTTSGVTVPTMPTWLSLYGTPDEAAVRPLRARDVRPGDRWVGILESVPVFGDTARRERLRGYWGYDFTVDRPFLRADGRIQLCVVRGDRRCAAPDAWLLVVPRCRPLPPPGLVREFTVTWRAQFEADSPLEAARQAYEQLRSYAERGGTWPPSLDVAHMGSDAHVTIDLHEETGR